MSQRTSAFRIPSVLAACLLLAGSACSKKDESKGVSLSRIDVAPAAATVAVGLETAFTATGTYSDGSTRDLTAEVLWTVEDGVAFFPGSAAAGTAHGLEAGGPAIVRAIQLGSSKVGEAALTVTDAVPVSIDVSPALVTLAAGLTQPLTATAVLSDGTHTDVTAQVAWSSSAPLVASVSTIPATAGTVSALAVGGPVTITATLAGPGLSGTATVNVSPAAIAAIDVAPAAGTLAAGRTLAFTADAVLTDGTRVPATEDGVWSSADPGIASVSNAAGSRGLVTGLRAGGPVTLTVRLPGVAAVGAASVSVSPADLVALSISPAESWLAAGTGAVLRAEGTFSDGTHADLTGAATWSSSDPAVASVGTGGAGAGIVSSVAAGGPVTITAALPAGGPAATATIHVTPAALVALEVAPAAASEPLGRSHPFTATGVFSDGSRQDLTTQVSWLSSDAAVASVSNALASAGLAQSRAEGVAEIVAWFPGSSTTASATFTVTPPELVSLALAPPSATLPAGRTQAFVALGTFTDAVVRDVTATAAWSTDLPGVAQATAVPGAFRGAAPGGPATITAVAAGIPATAQFTVGPPVLESIALSPPSIALRWGESATLTAVGTWSDTTQRDVTAEAAWSAAPGGIVRLELVGAVLQVGARGLGATVVTAAMEGVTATADVAVEPLYPDRIDVVPGTGLAQTGGTIRFRALATYPGGAVVDVSAAALWTPGDASIALLTPAPGVFEAISAGVTTVTATLGVAGTASLEVTDTPPVRVLASLRIDGNEPPLAVGGVAQLRALGTWNDGVEEDLSAAVAWSSTADTVLSVDAAGLAEALAAGAVTVTALHAPSSIAAQAAVQVLADRPVEALVVRLPPRIVASQPAPVAAIALLAGGGELDLTAAVRWMPVSSGTQVGSGIVRATGPRAEVAAILGDFVAIGRAEVVPLEAASRFEIVPGDATMAPATWGSTMPFVPFVSVLSFDDAWPREVIAGDCTDDAGQLMTCAFEWFMSGGLEPYPGCELSCMAVPGGTLCLPLAPTSRTLECRVGARVATATATVSDAPPEPVAAGLFVRPAGWAAQHQPAVNPEAMELWFDFSAPFQPPLHPGGILPLEAVAYFSDATFTEVPAGWSSTAPPIASVEADGLVRGRAPGSAAIQAAALDRTALLDVEVLPPLQAGGLQIAGPPGLNVGDTAQLEAWQLSGEDPEAGQVRVTDLVHWTSSDPAVASLVPGTPGRVVANGFGTTVIEARGRDGFSAAFQLTVVGIQQLFVTPASPVAQPFGWIELHAWGRFSDGSLRWLSLDATWAVTEPSIAMAQDPDMPWLFTTFDVGTTLVTASYGGLDASVTLEVTFVPPPPDVDSLLVGQIPPIAVGTTAWAPISCFLRDGSYCSVDPSFTFATGDPAVAEPVAGSPGEIRGLTAGSTTFSVSDPTGTVTATGPVTVYEISSIEVSPLVAAAAVGEGAFFTATGIDGLGGRHALDLVTWTSSDLTVAANSEPGDGFFLALAEGSVTITATAAGLQGTATMAVSPARPVGLAVRPTSIPIGLGDEVALTATLYVSDGTVRDVTAEVTWRSLDETVLAPPAAPPPGVFEGIAIGETLVVATWTGGGQTFTEVAAVRVKPPITQLFVVLEMERIPVGEMVMAQAGALFADGTVEEVTDLVTWSSSNPSVAAPEPTQPGFFLALAEGMTDVIATAPGGVTAFALLEVLPPYVVSIEIQPAVLDGVGFQEAHFTAIGHYSDGSQRDVTSEATWDAGWMGNVVAPGVIVPTTSGDIQVTAVLFGEFSEAFGSALLVVPPFIEQVWVEPNSASGLYGQRIQFIATGYLTDGQQVDLTSTATWSADRPEAVPTGTPGEFEFLGHGGFELRATTPEGNVFGVATAYIDVAPLTLTVAPAAATVDQYSGASFSATVELSDGTIFDVTWESFWSVVDGAIGYSGSPGVFIANSPGTTDFVASYTYGVVTVEGRAAVTVVPYVTDFVLTQPPGPYPYGQPVQFGAQLYWSDGTITDATATSAWSADRPEAVPTGNPGEFRFDGVGDFLVSATSPDGNWNRSVWAPVVALPVSLAIAPDAATVDHYSVASFAATVAYSDGSFVDVTGASSWESTDWAVAPAWGSGQYYGQVPGAAGVSASFTEWGVTVSDTATLTVLPIVAGYRIEAGSSSIRFDETTALTVWQDWSDGTATDYTGSAAWSVSDPSILAMAGPPGQVTAVGVGGSAVYAVVPIGLIQAWIDVRPFQGLVIAPANPTAPAGGASVLFTLTADDLGVPWDVTAYASWASTDTLVADFAGATPNEAVTGAVGTTFITAELPGGALTGTTLTVE